MIHIGIASYLHGNFAESVRSMILKSTFTTAWNSMVLWISECCLSTDKSLDTLDSHDRE